MNNLVKNLNELIVKHYEYMLDISEKNNYLEITLPMFLDDSRQLYLFLTKLDNKIILSSNLLYELESSLHKKVKNKKDILKEILTNEKEYSELKKALIAFGIDANNVNLISSKETHDEIEIYKEIIIYAELVKSYYNNLYHLLIKRLSKPHEHYKIFVKNFENIIKTVKKNQRIVLEKYPKTTLSASPIYTNDKLILSAGKDLDGLAKLYIDLKNIKSEKNSNISGLIFVKANEKHGNTVKTRLKTVYSELAEIGFKIKEIKENDDLEREIKSELKQRI